MSIFEQMESNVRVYCRSFKDVLYKAKGAIIQTESGKELIDFFAGAGALNYGHNNEYIMGKVVSYLTSGGVIHALDMHTVAKRDFLEKFSKIILEPRRLDYKVQFCGPTGTNAVEAALKLVRKIKPNQPQIMCFMGSYHGVSLGSLSVTGNKTKRAAAGQPLSNSVFMPFPGLFSDELDTIEFIESVLDDDSSGIEQPAAIILETVQAEGGVNVAPVEWLRRLRRLCDEREILMICDDIQAGCGRTGTFFSFERAGIVPDIVLLSKSISGYGGPMSLLLVKPEYDIWAPGEHNGTFRGYQLALVGASAALDYVSENHLEQQVKAKEESLTHLLNTKIKPISKNLLVRGIGLIWGIDVSRLGGADLAARISARAYELGLLIETVGRGDTVLKIMPPLNIEDEYLVEGCTILSKAIRDCLDM